MIGGRKFLLLGGIIVVAVAALALGVPVGTLLLVGATLLCPAVMFFGMNAMGAEGGGCGHSAKCHHAEAQGTEQSNDAREQRKVGEVNS